MKKIALAGLMALATAGLFTATAKADDWRYRDGYGDRHEYREHERHEMREHERRERAERRWREHEWREHEYIERAPRSYYYNQYSTPYTAPANGYYDSYGNWHPYGY